MLLEFERFGESHSPVRYARPATGPMLSALRAGEPIGRDSLREQLERALAEGTPVDSGERGGRMRTWRPLAGVESLGHPGGE
jgi:hypothetical protein